jgi:hypothetical protein
MPDSEDRGYTRGAVLVQELKAHPTLGSPRHLHFQGELATNERNILTDRGFL